MNNWIILGPLLLISAILSGINPAKNSLIFSQYEVLQMQNDDYSNRDMEWISGTRKSGTSDFSKL
jgi:hypothetical protein